MPQLSPLTIIVLNDNIAGRWCRAEHGLSFLIKADQTVLFDTGSTDLIRYNAQILTIDLQKIQTIVLSHGHDDHTGGLMLFEGQHLICHPDVFMKRFRKSNHTSLGIKWDLEELCSRFKLKLSREAFQLSDQIFFLGEIPRINAFESQTTAFQTADGTDDFVLDDTGLAVITSKGLVVISGCAHSGICNMVSHARKVTGIEEVYQVIGGFHLQNDDELTQKTVEWLKDNDVKHVVPSHCSGFHAQMAISRQYHFLPLKSGSIIEIG